MYIPINPVFATIPAPERVHAEENLRRWAAAALTAVTHHIAKLG